MLCALCSCHGMLHVDARGEGSCSLPGSGTVATRSRGQPCASYWPRDAAQLAPLAGHAMKNTPRRPRRAETLGQPSSPPHAIAATGAAVAFSEWHISDARDSTGYLQQISLTSGPAARLHHLKSNRAPAQQRAPRTRQPRRAAAAPWPPAPRRGRDSVKPATRRRRRRLHH